MCCDHWGRIEKKIINELQKITSDMAALKTIACPQKACNKYIGSVIMFLWYFCIFLMLNFKFCCIMEKSIEHPQNVCYVLHERNEASQTSLTWHEGEQMTTELSVLAQLFLLENCHRGDNLMMFPSFPRFTQTRYTKSSALLITQTLIYHFILSLLISVLSHWTAQNSAAHVGSRTVIV